MTEITDLDGVEQETQTRPPSRTGVNWKRVGQLLLIAALLSVLNFLMFPSWTLHRAIAFFLGFSAILIVPYWWRATSPHRLTVAGVVAEAVLVAALFALVDFFALGWSAPSSAVVFAAVLAAELIVGAFRLRRRKPPSDPR